MKYILLTALALSQMTPCLAHEGHDKAFADKDALTTTTKRIKISPEGQVAIGIKTIETKSKRLAAKLEITGKVEPAENRVSLVTSPVAGVLTRIDVQQGSTVKAGATLGTVYSAAVATVFVDLFNESSLIRAEMTKIKAQAQNDVRLQGADVGHYLQDMEREKNLVDAGITARKNYLEAEHALNLARTRLSGTEKQLADNLSALQARLQTLTEATKRKLAIMGVPNAQINKAIANNKVLADIPIVSPESGIVFSRDVTQGESVDPSKKLVSIINLSPIWVTLDLHPDQLSQIRLGQQVKIKPPLGPDVSGTISYIAPIVDRTERTIHVRVVCPNKQAILRPEMFVTSSITTGIQPTAKIVVPAQSLIDEGGRNFVYVKYGDSFQPVPVSRGAKIGEEVEIIDGLYEGDQVVSNGALQIKAQSMLASAEPESEKAPDKKTVDKSFVETRLSDLMFFVGGILTGVLATLLGLKLKKAPSQASRTSGGADE